MPVAIGINIAMATLVNLAKLPVFLDTVGTAAMGVLFGPLAGVLTGVISNLIAGLVVSPVYPWFVLTSAFVGFAAGALARRGAFRRWWSAAVSGLVVGLVAAVLSAPVATYVFGGVTPAGSYSVIVAFLKATGNTLLKSAMLAGLASDPVDKAATFLLVFLLVRGLPKTVIARLQVGTNVGTP
jgi:energy-coupling factor transport system substrate-specific component